MGLAGKIRHAESSFSALDVATSENVSRISVFLTAKALGRIGSPKNMNL